MNKLIEPKSQLSYKLWEDKWPKDHSMLSYYHHGRKFPIGFINGGQISLKDGIEVVRTTFSDQSGPIIHLALAPHATHNIMHLLPEIPSRDKTFIGDGIIVPKTGKFAIGSFVADCTIGIVASDKHIGYFHVGRPEIISDPPLLENFLRCWPDSPRDTMVYIGPVIQGNHYEVTKLEKRWKKYSVKTIWGTEGFEIKTALKDQLSKIPSSQIKFSDIDPFEEMEMYGEKSRIFSDQWYKHYKNDPDREQTVFCPRNLALFAHKPC